MSGSAVFPWHESVWRSLQERIQQGRMPHALLLVGPQGLGKRLFAESLAKARFCESPDELGHACGKCSACHWMEADTYPDYWLCAPEDDSSVIKIQAIRELSKALALTPQGTGAKIAILDPADRMNNASANALLKTLEEPSEGSLLLLITHRPASLPATILSRCQVLTFQVPELEQGRDWLLAQGVATDEAERLLALSSNAPLRALEMAKDPYYAERGEHLKRFLSVRSKGDPIAAASVWGKTGLADAVFWLTVWVNDLLRFKLTGDAQNVRDQAFVNELTAGASQLEAYTLLNYLDVLNETARLVETSVNASLALEKLMVRWSEI